MLILALLLGAPKAPRGSPPWFPWIPLKGLPDLLSGTSRERRVKPIITFKFCSAASLKEIQGAQERAKSREHRESSLPGLLLGPSLGSLELPHTSLNSTKATRHLGKSISAHSSIRPWGGGATLLSLEVPLRRSGSPFKGIQGNQESLFLLVFYRKIELFFQRRSTFNRSTFKEVRVPATGP